MSLPIPLAVRLSTSRDPSRHITREVRDLSLRWTDPGGYASCRVALDRPLSLQPDEIAYYGTLTVYDTRSGATVWEGRLEDPGRSAGGQGQVWDLAAVGGQAHTRDRVVPLIYADRSLERWQTHSASARYMQISRRSDPTPAIEIKAEQGVTWGSGASGDVYYRAVADAGQSLARVSLAWDTGMTDPGGTEVFLSTAAANGAQTRQAFAASNTAGGTLSAYRGNGAPTVAVGAITAGHDWAYLRLIRPTSSATAGATSWGEFSTVRVRGLLKSAAGADVTSGYTADTVLASEVVADLLGRLLTAYDGAGASITATSYGIDQLAYPDGVDAARVLADLLALEAGFTWRVWERNSAGKYRFEWTAIPATVRYEADVSDGYDSMGSSDGLYNRVTVRWRDAAGVAQTTERTATVATLSAAGLVRQGSIDLGGEVGSLADAQRAGDQWLSDRAYPPNAGRLRIARPVLDLQTGRMVQPWEVQPGLIRVRGILPRVDALNAVARDGVTVFRIVGSEFRASDGAATLELDSYAPSTAQMLADARQLAERAITRR